MDAADLPTGATLFNLIDRRDDPAAWQRFLSRYGPLIHAWCRRWHVPDADTDDAVQDVLLRLHRYLGAGRRQFPRVPQDGHAQRPARPGPGEPAAGPRQRRQPGATAPGEPAGRRGPVPAAGPRVRPGDP